MDRAQRAYRRAGIGLNVRFDVLPEADDVIALAVRDGFHFRRGRYDGATGTRAERGYGELAHNPLGIRPFGIRQRARHARDDR